MGIETSSDYTLIKDEQGRVVFAVGPSESLPTAGIPEGTLAWDPVDRQLMSLTSGSWASTALTAGAITADVTGDLTGDVTGDVTGNVTGYIIVPTDDPGVAGAVWNDSGSLAISAGA